MGQSEHRRAVVQARGAAAIGEERALAVLTTPELDLGLIGDGHVLSLALTGLLDADAYYRCPHASGDVFVVLDVPAVRQRAEYPALHAMMVVTQAAGCLPYGLDWTMVLAYLRPLDLPVTDTTDEIRIGDGTAGTFAFDGQGRLAGIKGTVAPPDR